MLNKREKMLICRNITKLHLGGYHYPPPKKNITNSISYVLARTILFLISLSLVLNPTDSYCSESTKKSGDSSLFQLEPFITNIGDGRRFLKLSISIELSSPAMAERVKAKTGAIRDAVIMLITTKSPNDVSSPEGKQQLKDEILIKLNQILGKDCIKNIYFTDFVMQ